MSETSIEPQSVAADKEPERKVRTFRVLKHDAATIDGGSVWNELPNTYDTVWTPAAADIGEQFGEGDYLLIEQDDTYSFKSTYPMHVVAEKRYRLADDDTA